MAVLNDGHIAYIQQVFDKIDQDDNQHLNDEDFVQAFGSQKNSQQFWNQILYGQVLDILVYVPSTLVYGLCPLPPCSASKNPSSLVIICHMC